MRSLFDDLMEGLNEVLEDVQGKKKLPRRVVTILPVKEYEAHEIKAIRQSTGMTQVSFASYMGVSNKTVEAWEAGTSKPNGSARRLLSMMEMDENLTKDFPFVSVV